MDFPSLLMSLCVVLFVAIAIPAVWRHLVVIYKLKNMACPKGLPVLGNLLQLGTTSSSFFTAMWKWVDEFRENGTYVFYVGMRPVVVIYNAEDTETIVCNPRLETKAYFYFFMRSWVRDGMFISKGPKWVSRRKLLTPSFHFSILSKFLVVFYEQAKLLTDKLSGMVKETQVDLGPLVTLCTLDIACGQFLFRLALLDLMIEAQRQNSTFTDEGIQEEVDTFMFAGHDTVSVSTTFALYLIGRHPEVQQKLQKELDKVFGNDRERPVSPEDLPILEYLTCVVKESLRLLPTAPVLGRELDEDVNACGVTIPKGTMVFLGYFWLHRDPKRFPDPEKFDPDRFSPVNSEARHNFAYLPFGAGHRNCIGQKFALMEEKVVLATILRKLNVTSLQCMDEIGLTFEMVLRAQNGINVSLSLR